MGAKEKNYVTEKQFKIRLFFFEVLTLFNFVNSKPAILYGPLENTFFKKLSS